MNHIKQYHTNTTFHANEIVRAYYHDETYIHTPMHTHDFYELNIVISGNGQHLINDSTFYITSGDVFIMPPHIKHGYIFDTKHYSIFHLLFHKHFFEKYKSDLSNISSYQILFDIEPKVREYDNVINNFLHINIAESYNLIRIFDELDSLKNELKDNTQEKKEHLTLYVIARICEMIKESKNEYNTNNNRYLFELLNTIEYIHSNYKSDINLQTLCDMCCMSRSSYIRNFKMIFNCTPIHYILNYRLRQSKSLLKYTNLSLTAIANECGFFDNAHFCRQFKEKYQISPSKYRENSKAKTHLSKNAEKL